MTMSFKKFKNTLLAVRLGMRSHLMLVSRKYHQEKKNHIYNKISRRDLNLYPKSQGSKTMSISPVTVTPYP